MFRADAFCHALAVFGGLMLLTSAGMTCSSVLGRSFFNSPLVGDFEMMEFGAALSVLSFLPLVCLRHGNITVLFFSSKFSSAAQAILDRLALALFAFCFALLGLFAIFGASEAYLYNTSSPILGLPIFLGIGYSAFCFAICSGVCLSLLFSRHQPSPRPKKIDVT